MACTSPLAESLVRRALRATDEATRRFSSRTRRRSSTTEWYCELAPQLGMVNPLAEAAFAQLPEVEEPRWDS